MPRRMTGWFSIACGLLGVAAGAWAAGHNEPLSGARLLVDLARDHGLKQRGKQSPADVQHVRALLQAAVRLDPQQPEPYAWLYELAVLGGDEHEATRMLHGLLKADPTHEGAFARWLEAVVHGQQTAEQCEQWLQSLSAEPRPAAQQSMVQVCRARLALERLDRTLARDLLTRALELEPANLDAARLMLETFDDHTDAVTRLRAALRVLQLQPLSIEAAWHVALLLDEYGLAGEAERFYEYASALQEQADPLGSFPAAFLLDLAYHHAAQGRFDEAVDRVREAIKADQTRVAEGGMLLHHLLRRAGRNAEADRIRVGLAARFAKLRDPAQARVNDVAQAAWFYCRLVEQPQRALMLAENAVRRAPADVFVQRVLGWAQALNLRPQDALKTLLPIADRDPYAAWMAARLLLESGDQARALCVLAALDPKPPAGPAHDLLRGATLLLDESDPLRRYPQVAMALAEFDDRVLEFWRNPAAFLYAGAVMEDRSPAPGEPWWAEFTLTNRGPFPITLGPDAMANPVFMLSFQVEGDRKRSYPALLTVSVDRTRVLYPGQSVRRRQTIDVGPLRQMSRQTPQHLQRLTMEAILDAALDRDGRWQPAAAGQRVPTVYFNRVPAGARREAVGALFSALAGDSTARRWLALEVLAELMGERQLADWGRLSYQPNPVPTKRIRALLLDLLASESWEVRARTLIAFQIVGLDRKMVRAVEAGLDDPHWLVRMMAVRVLGRQGAAFAEQAASVARNDSDELVRALAESYRTAPAAPPEPAAGSPPAKEH